MDNIRVILIGALFAVIFMSWQAWQKDYGQNAQPQSEPASLDVSDVPSVDDDLDANANAEPDLASDVPAVPREDGDTTPAPMSQTDDTANAGSVHVVTDVLDLTIDLRGGSLVSAALLDYPVSLDRPERKLKLLNQTREQYFVIEGGLVSRNNKTPTNRSIYTSASKEYRQQDGSVLRVPLTWTDGAGITVTKTYIFTPGSYLIGVEYAVVNGSNADYKVNQYSQLVRSGVAPENATPMMQTFFGAAIYEEKDDGGYRYREVDFEDLHDEPVELRQDGGWAGMVQHYFLAAILPPEEDTQVYTAVPQKTAGRYMVRSTSLSVVIPAGSEKTLNNSVFVGPKLQERLKDLAPGLELTVDYSWLSFVAKPLFWLLNWLHGVFGNWGIAIILITVVVKAAFYKLSEAQYRSMAKMKVFAPRIKALRERYPDDKQKMQQAMMKLYKEEKFNPLGGCWPLLVQIPVFIALYWVLLESVELRQAPFFLWIDDLSVRDPYFVMPLLLGAAMFAQQRLSNQAMTMDPMQAKIMQFMPVMMTVFFAFFPAGLVLYWFFNTLLGMLQQWYITRKMDAQTNAAGKSVSKK